MEIKTLLKWVIETKASDLHIVVGLPPHVRIDGHLRPIEDQPVVTDRNVKDLIYPLLLPTQKDLFLVNKELDFSFELGNLGRFRANVYHQKGSMAAALRLIPKEIRTIEELKLPKICHQFTKLRQGLILVTGPTGHGKSTTLAAMIDEVNATRSEHIVTIEDPIEYVYQPKKSIVSQREMHADTHSWTVALRSVLREDPDVVLVGEMRDFETIAAALTVAETGHLVLATLHTNSAGQTMDRIIDVFPEHQQAQIKMQLSNVLEAVISQRLVPSLGSGRLPACEILVATSAVKTSIREGKTHLINNIIQTSADVGMQTLETDLARLVMSGQISQEVAEEWSLSPNDLKRMISKRT